MIGLYESQDAWRTGAGLCKGAMEKPLESVCLSSPILVVVNPFADLYKKDGRVRIQTKPCLPLIWCLALRY